MGLMERIGRAIGIGRGEAASAAPMAQRRTDPFWRLAYPGGGYGVSAGGVPVGIGQSLARPSQRSLRDFARTPYARRAINAIKNPIAGLSFEIGLRPGVAVTPDVTARMTALRHAFDRPNRDDSFRSLIEQVLEDTLCGAGAIEQQLTGDPLRPVMLWPADGLSIEVDAGWDGEAGSIRYRQSYSGIGSASVELTNDELIYIRPNPSTHTPFGLGPLEVAFQSIARQLAVADYAGKVAANTRPGLMLNLGPEIGIDQIQAFRSYWRNEVEGQGLMPIIGAGKEVQALRLTPEGDGALYLKYQDWIVREIASCFDLSPQNMGLERDVNRGTSETAQDRDWDQAIKPFAGLIAAHLNRDLIQGLLGDHDLEFRWTGLDRADEQATSEIWRTYYTTNVLTPNEMRTRLGLPKLTAQWGDLLYADAQIAISAARGTKRLDDPTLSDAATPAGTTQAYNQNHQPAGSPEGGQFAPGEGGGDGGDDKSAGQYLRDKLERDQGTEPDHSNNYDVADNGNTGKSDKETTAKPDIPKDISKDGADFIKNAESRGGKPNLKEYDDGKGNWTIGWGHKMSDDDRELYKSGINEQQADGIFKKDIEQAQRDVQRYVKVDINQEQYDALVSFSYQLDGKQFRESDAVKFLNEGKYEEAADSMQKWGTDAPGALDGDIERRKGEANRFRLGTFKMR